jgi:N-acetylglucosamine kinase-like BadF-type ATPase
LGKTLLNGGNGVFFLGIDGGGTKTAFLLINENGDIIEAKTIATVSYKHVGMDNSIALLKETVHEILNDREAYICLALPNWGESKDGDGEFLSRIKEITELPVKIVNDSVVGWAGSLGLSSGINLVAGTGSIAYGRNDAGEEARAGGWDERYIEFYFRRDTGNDRIVSLCGQSSGRRSG